MALYETGLLARDLDFLTRVAAAYSILTNTGDGETWANQHLWEVASTEGFGDKYAQGVKAQNVTNPGRDTSIITDQEVMDAVQVLLDRGVAVQ